MIHYIKGRITETTDSGVVIERNGIGYELTVPALSAVYMRRRIRKLRSIRR